MYLVKNITELENIQWDILVSDTAIIFMLYTFYTFDNLLSKHSLNCQV